MYVDKLTRSAHVEQTVTYAGQEGKNQQPVDD